MDFPANCTKQNRMVLSFVERKMVKVCIVKISHYVIDNSCLLKYPFDER